MRQYVENQDTLNAWADKTFGRAGSALLLAIRAQKELTELIEALAINPTDPHAIEEAADTVMVLYRVVDRLGGDLHAAIDAKMIINRARKWNVNEHGIAYHKNNT